MMQYLMQMYIRIQPLYNQTVDEAILQRSRVVFIRPTRLLATTDRSGILSMIFSNNWLWACCFDLSIPFHQKGKKKEKKTNINHAAPVGS